MSKHKKVNVYKYVLSKPLFYGRFEFMEDLSMITKEFIMNYDKEDNLSYSFLVDNDYPVYVQPEDSDLLILSEKKKVNIYIKLACSFYHLLHYVCQIKLLHQA